MRSGVTSGQLRQTNACSRVGKCGKTTGFGAAPLGKSAKPTADCAALGAPHVGQAEAPRAIPPVTTVLLRRNDRREQCNDLWEVFSLLIMLIVCSVFPSFVFVAQAGFIGGAFRSGLGPDSGCRARPNAAAAPGHGAERLATR